MQKISELNSNLTVSHQSMMHFATYRCETIAF